MAIIAHPNLSTNVKLPGKHYLVPNFLEQIQFYIKPTPLTSSISESNYTTAFPFQIIKQTFVIVKKTFINRDNMGTTPGRLVHQLCRLLIFMNRPYGVWLGSPFISVSIQSLTLRTFGT